MLVVFVLMIVGTIFYMIQFLSCLSGYSVFSLVPSLYNIIKSKVSLRISPSQGGTISDYEIWIIVVLAGNRNKLYEIMLFSVKEH